MDPCLSISELRAQLLDKPKLIFEYIDSVYDVIERVESRVRAFITLREREKVLRDAKRLVERGSEGLRKLRLFGTLVAIKDNIVTKELRTTCGSKILNNFIPPYSATVVERLLREGAIVIGKTNMDEFAMGSTTENSAYFITRNPWDLERVPGGSSGGSAVATRLCEATFSLGSDTGGSVRAPAAFTGVVGYKPTYGLVSRFGLVAYANSLEQIGPMGREVSDVVHVMDIISGHDPRDHTTLKIEPEFKGLEGNVKLDRVRAAVVEEMVSSEGVEVSVRRAFERSLRKLEASGVKITWVSLDILKYVLPAYYIIAMAEASSNLARYTGLLYGPKAEVEGRNWADVFSEVRSKFFGDEVKRRILLGTFVLSAGYAERYYLRALKVRVKLKEEFRKLWKLSDFILSPTMPLLPPRIGEKIKDPLTMYLMDINTVTANMLGTPAISLPCGLENHLPVGFQVMGSYLSDSKLLDFSFKLEELFGKLPTPQV